MFILYGMLYYGMVCYIIVYYTLYYSLLCCVITCNVHYGLIFLVMRCGVPRSDLTSYNITCV